VIDDDYGKAKSFNYYFSSVFTKEDNSPLPQLPNSYPSIDPVVISTAGVANFTFRNVRSMSDNIPTQGNSCWLGSIIARLCYTRHQWSRVESQMNGRKLKWCLFIIVLYSRDHQGLGVAQEEISPKNQPHFSHTTMWQYWLGKTKPKKVFRSTQNAFNKLLKNFKNFLFNGIFYWLTTSN